MEVSRLIFTKETKEKMEQGLNATQRGVLRWNKVKESEDDGRLMLAKNRHDVANIAGFTENNKMRGYQWVSNMISRGHLREIPLGVNRNKKMDYEYHVVRDPDYSRHKARDAKRSKQRKSIVQNTPQTKVVINEPIKEFGKYKLEFSRGDVTIKLELDDYEKVAELIKAILKGE